MMKGPGFVKGIVIGAALGLLFAPKSGRELRKDLMKKRDDLMDTANDYKGTVKDAASDIQSVAKDSAKISRA